MEQRLKERLIGAIVLVALAVWLIPWLLDGPEQAPPETAALELPAAEESAPLKTVSIDLDERERPDVPAGGAPRPAQAEGSEQSTSAPAASADARGAASARAEPDAETQTQTQAQAQARAQTAPAEPEPQASASAAEQAGDWEVQLGSFGEAGNAERLAARVKTYGYTPKVSTYLSGGRNLHRVRVGPQPSRARAEAVASALSAHGFVAQVVTAD